jgi:hypothetical protein
MAVQLSITARNARLDAVVGSVADAVDRNSWAGQKLKTALGYRAFAAESRPREGKPE